MATSGNFTTSNTGGIGAAYPKNATYSWWINSQSVANNTTDIGYKLVLGGGTSSGSSIAVYNCSTSTDGEGKSFSGGGTYYGNGKELISGTKTIQHSADGTKSFSASASINLFWSSGHTVSGSGTWTLPTIARQANLSTAPSSFNDDASPTITYTNAAGSAVSSLQACIATRDGNTIYAAYRDVNKTGTLSYKFNLTTAERNALLAACSGSNELNTIAFWLKTVIGGTTFYSTINTTMKVVNANPTFRNYTYSDTNSTITAITGNNQVLVSGKSNLSVVISSANKAVANKQATMKTYLASLSGKTVSANYSSSGNTLTFTSNAFTAGTQTLSVKATDSRGNYTIVNKNVTVVGYSNPVINAVAQRVNNFENNTTITFSGSISPITVSGTRKNNLVGNVQYRYKNQNTSTWGSWTNLTASVAANGTLTINSITLSLANTSSWDMQVKVQDKLATTTKSIVISQGQPQFFVGDDGRVAVGGTPAYSKGSSDAGLLDVKGKIYASSSIYTNGNLSTQYGWDYQINSRLHNGGSTTIPANANLNSKSYCQIGTYCCPSAANGATVSNNPSGGAFTMEVRALLASGTLNLDGTWQYIERVLRCGTDNTIYRQYCDIGGTAGSIRYGIWQRYDIFDNRAQKGVWSSFYYAGTNANDQDITVYTKKGTALTLRMENGGGILLVKGGAGNIKFARQTWSTKYTAMNQNYGVKGLSSGSTVYTRYIGAVVNNDVPNCGEWVEKVDGGDTSNGYYGNLASTLGGNRNATTCSMTMTRVGGSGWAWALQGTISSNGIRCAMSFDAEVTALNNNYIPTTYQRGENKNNTSAYSQLLEVFEN